MQASLVTSLMLPLALGVIMFGLGLGLSLDDFRRVGRYPRAVVVGLGLQILILPWVAFGLALAFRLPPELAVGLMLLAASPGGATANIYSHLARGDVALNITLTAINSALCLLTLPLILNLSLEHFLGAGQYVPPPTRKIVEVAVVVLGLLIAAALAQSWQVLVAYLAAVGAACLLFNLASLGAGYLAPRALRLPHAQALAISLEIGIHNGTLAIYIALGVLANGTIAVPAAIYSVLMFFTAAVFAWWATRGRRGEGVHEAA